MINKTFNGYFIPTFNFLKLKTVRYFGSFYEHENKLGWMPFWKVAIIKIVAPNEVHWIKQHEVNFIKKS